MSLLKKIIGYDLHTSRLVFNYEGIELVFIHDFFLVKRRIYVDGEMVFSRYSEWLGFITNTEFEHQGREFRIVSRVLNFLTFKQDVTVWVDGQQAGRKIDRFYAALSIPQKLHAVLGVVGLGLVIGFTIPSLGTGLSKLIEMLIGT